MISQRKPTGILFCAQISLLRRQNYELQTAVVEINAKSKEPVSRQFARYCNHKNMKRALQYASVNTHRISFGCFSFFFRRFAPQ